MAGYPGRFFDMAPASTNSLARSRKIEALILQRLADVGLEPVSDAIGVDNSTVSRWKGKEIPQLSTMLAMLGLKVVPREFRCYEEEEIQAIWTLARARMAKMEHSHELADDDPE